MSNLLLQTGRLAGIVGFLLCLFAGVARLAGWHWLGSFETLTFLQAGIAGMVLGCFCLLILLSNRTDRS